MKDLMRIIQILHNAQEEAAQRGIIMYNFDDKKAVIRNSLLSTLCKDNTFSIVKLNGENSFFEYMYQIEIDGITFTAYANSPDYEVAANEG